MDILERAKNGIVVFDGGMGTMIQPYMKLGELPEMLNITMPDVIYGVHKAYLEAGADVVETNTLNANRRKLALAGQSVENVITAAVNNARRAVSECGRGYVALSMGSTGVMLEPLGDMSFDEAVDIYAEMAAAGAKAGADLILIETVSDLHEIKAAIYGAKQETQLPVAVTMTFDENGRTLTGADIKTSVVTLEALGADIVGMNCGLGPDMMCRLMPQLAACASVPVLINPNAGLPRLVDGKSVYAVGPDEFAGDAALLAQAGARLLGGCCGTTPEHIRALCRLIEGVQPAATGSTAPAAITSGARCVELDGGAEIARLSDDDIDDLLDSAMEAEADAIMVACAPLDEAVTALQEMYLKPMYLVSDDMDEMEKALRYYNGKPLIGVANAGSIEGFIALARRGAALAVADEALAEKAAQALGARNVFIDKGDGRLLCADGTPAADITEE